MYAKLPAGARSFEEVKPKLLAEQREQAQRDAFEGLIADLRKQATVRVLYKPEGPPGSPGAQAPGTAPAAPKAGNPGQPSQGSNHLQGFSGRCTADEGSFKVQALSGDILGQGDIPGGGGHSLFFRQKTRECPPHGRVSLPTAG